MSQIPIFIISLPNSTRVDSIKSQLEQLGLKFEVVQGVDGKLMTESDIATNVDTNSCYARLGYEISTGLIGCYLGHLSVYEKAKSKDCEWVLVLEEDAQIKEFSMEVIQEFQDILSEQPAIIQLFSRSNRLADKRTFVRLRDNYFGFRFRPRLIGNGAAAYLINKKALYLATQSRTVKGAPDWPPWSQKVEFYGIYPWMFFEGPTGSEIPNNAIDTNRYRFRRVQQVLGIHYFVYRSSYTGFLGYFMEEIRPYFLYLRWKASGSKTFDKQLNSPQIL
jgi:GR25 family glycosyltransferase involved in LPS biosynthesis